MARVFEAHGFGPASAFMEAAQEASLVADVDPEASDLEGVLAGTGPAEKTTQNRVQHDGCRPSRGRRETA